MFETGYSEKCFDRSKLFHYYYCLFFSNRIISIPPTQDKIPVQEFEFILTHKLHILKLCFGQGVRPIEH